MILYNVTYPGNSMDTDIPLSSAAKIEGAIAVSSWDGEQLVFHAGEWVKEK